MSSEEIIYDLQNEINSFKKRIKELELKGNDSDNESDTTLFSLVNDDYGWEYLEVSPYPLTTLDLTKDYFKNKTVKVFDKYVGPARSGSGDSSTCYFGKIKNENIYFYIMDDPGYSGYDCCGSITLYYSDSIDIVKENMDYIRKVNKDDY